MAPSPYHQMAATFAQGFAVIAVISLIAVNAVGVFVMPAPRAFVNGFAMAVLSCVFAWLNWRMAAVGLPKRHTDLVMCAVLLLVIGSLCAFVIGAS